MKWGNSRTDVHTYFRVRLSDFAELEQLDCFGDGGTIDESQFTALRVSGSLPVTNFPSIGNDMVRIYVTVTDEDGQQYTAPLATLIPTYPEQEITSGGDSGTLTLYSTLYLASVRKTTGVFTIPAGEVAITWAAALLATCGIPVIADASAATLNVAKTYDPLTDYLSIVNDLCAFAGFAACTVDGYGNAILHEYRNPAEKSPAVTMQDGVDGYGDGCGFAPTVKHELDTFAIPNRYTVVSSSAEDAPMTATAVNADPSSAVSTVSRGYIVDGGETVSDIADATALQSLAERRLADATSAVESITITHLWQPFDIGDVVRIIYDSANESWTFAACNRTIHLMRGTQCDTRLRRFI